MSVPLVSHTQLINGTFTLWIHLISLGELFGWQVEHVKSLEDVRTYLFMYLRLLLFSLCSLVPGCMTVIERFGDYTVTVLLNFMISQEG